MKAVLRGTTGGLLLLLTLVASASATRGPSRYLIEYTDIGPGSNTPQAAAAGLTGAAWVELREITHPSDEPDCTIDTCPIISDGWFGFAPDDSAIFKTQGDLIDEAGHPWTWRIAIPLSASQFAAAEQFIQSVALPDYGLYISDISGGIWPHNFGDDAWPSFMGTALGTNCMDFVQAVQDAAGVRSAGHPAILAPGGIPVQGSAVSDPVNLYRYLTGGGNGPSVGGEISANPLPLDYSDRVDPPDACSVLNIEQAVLKSPQALSGGLHLFYTRQSGPDLPLTGSGPKGDQPPFTGGYAFPQNDPLEDPSLKYDGQVLEFAQWGDGSDSVGEPHGAAYQCGTDQFGNPAYCAGHSYEGEGPYDVRYFEWGYGNALEEYDSSWTYDPNNTNMWMPDYQSPSGAAAFCVAPGRASDLAPGRAPDAVAAQGTSGSVSMCDHQYVALGDSYSAGDGAVLPNKKGQDYPDSCHRTRQAYPPLAARAIGMTLKDEACSGATTEDVLSKQLGPLAPDTKLVSITIGGNDAELFGYNGLVGCLLSPTAKLIKQSPSDWFASCEHRLRGKIASGLRTLKSKLVSVYRAIEQRAPHARLLVLEYPNPFPPAVEIHVKGHRVRIGDVICPASYDGFVELLGARLPADLFAHIWASDIPYLHDVVESLDAHVRDAAQAAGATALPMDSAPSDFRSHTVCDVGRQWFYGIRFPPYPTPSSLHPNIPGNLAMARAVEAAAPR